MATAKPTSMLFGGGANRRSVGVFRLASTITLVVVLLLLLLFLLSIIVIPLSPSFMYTSLTFKVDPLY